MSLKIARENDLKYHNQDCETIFLRCIETSKGRMQEIRKLKTREYYPLYILISRFTDIDIVHNFNTGLFKQYPHRAIVLCEFISL